MVPRKIGGGGDSCGYMSPYFHRVRIGNFLFTGAEPIDGVDTKGLMSRYLV